MVGILLGKADCTVVAILLPDCGVTGVFIGHRIYCVANTGVEICCATGCDTDEPETARGEVNIF